MRTSPVWTWTGLVRGGAGRAVRPFVMNNRAELQQAVEDFQAGRMGQIPAGHA